MESGVSGEISSQKYPDNYPNDFEEFYHIKVEEGSIIKLVMIDVQLEYQFQCKFDYLQIFDSDEKEIVKTCGKTIPAPILSSSNSLTIVFKSDESKSGRGFFAKWTSI